MWLGICTCWSLVWAQHVTYLDVGNAGAVWNRRRPAPLLTIAACLYDARCSH
jgi:hypothetical protein